MFWNNFELKTPSPNRLDERNSRKVLHSPWTAQRMKKKGRNAKLSPTTDGPVYDIHRDLNCERPVLMDVSNASLVTRFMPDSMDFSNEHTIRTSESGAATCCPPHPRSPEQETVHHVGATARTSEGTQNGIPSHSMTNSGTGRSSFSGHVLPHERGPTDMGLQTKKPKRRFLFRRHNEVSWQCGIEDGGAAVDDSAASICYNNNSNKAQKRASPPTPWPGKGTLQGQICETSGRDSCTASAAREKLLSTGSQRRGLSRFMPMSIKAYFPARESKRETVPHGTPSEQTGLSRVETTRSTLSGGKSPEPGKGNLMVHLGFSAGRSSMEVVNTGSPMRESPDASSPSPPMQSNCRNLSYLPVSHQHPAHGSVESTACQAFSPMSDITESDTSPGSGMLSDSSRAADMSELNLENSEVSLPVPLRFTRGPVSEDGSEIFPTPRLHGSPLAELVGEENDDSARAPLKIRGGSVSRTCQVVDLASFNERLQKAVEEDDVEAMEEAVDTVKEGKVLPDIETLNNLLMCLCKIQGDLSEATDLVKTTCRRANLQPTSTTYHCLTAMGVRQDMAQSFGQL